MELKSRFRTVHYLLCGMFLLFGYTDVTANAGISVASSRSEFRADFASIGSSLEDYVKIIGVVVDVKGDPLIGATVVEKDQKTQEESEMYPNVDWKDYMFKDVAVDYKVDASICGGNKFAKYFCSVGYLNESDMVKKIDTGRGYNGGISYQRFNDRSNIDMNLTKTTKLSIGLSGIYSMRTSPEYSEAGERWYSAMGKASSYYLK